MGDFKYGLFGCFGDIKTCLISYLLPCVTIGRIADHVDFKFAGFNGCLPCGAATFIPFFNCFLAYSIRKMSREKAGASPMFDFWPEVVDDIFTGLFCGCCSTIQEARHFDLDLLKVPDGGDIKRN